MIQLILTEADADIIEVKTSLKNVFLRTLLANSITIIPGAISLELKDDTITVLWLKRREDDSRHARKTIESLKCKLERILLKAEA